MRFARLAALALVVLAAPRGSQAQSAPKVATVGILDVGSAADSSPRMVALQKSLHELGYVEGQSIKIEWRFAEGQTARLSTLAKELVNTKPDVLVSPNSGGVRALHNATSAIPIVMAGADAGTTVINPQNLARPINNVTGVIAITRELENKRMELLREALPGVSRVATFRDLTDFPYREGRMAKAQFERWGFTFIAIIVGGPEDFPAAFTAVAQDGAKALVLGETPMLYTHRRRLAELAIRHRLAWVAVDRDYVEAGCLLSYGADRNDLVHRAATYVDRLLRGAKPADLPIGQPTKFELVINRKTAKALGLTIPPSVLARADEVIE
jgi:putative tryptophan/tyrosine transport system substrate-binding protein